MHNMDCCLKDGGAADLIELGNRDTLYFLHIRKTGGTTLLTLLMDNFHHDQILKLWDWEELLDNMPNDFTKYRFIHGHFGFRFHQLLPEKPLVVTMLRNPIELVISNFNEYKRERRDEGVRKFYDGKTIDEVLVHPLERFLYLNLQVRDVANDYLNPYWHLERDVSNDRLRPYLHKEKQESSYYDIYEGRTEQEVLAVAKERLKEFAFIGLVDSYQKSLFLLAFTFGWTPIRNVVPKNTANGIDIKKSQVSDSTIEQINELTRLDQDLYEFGKQIFEDRYGKMVNELKLRYYRPSFDELPELDAVYEMLQLWYSEIYEKKYPVMCDDIKVDFKDVLFGWGWEEREQITSTKVFRWTGPETQSIIDLPLKRTHDFEIVIRMVGYVSVEILESFRLCVNKSTNVLPLTMERESPTAQHVTFKGIIPRSFLQSQYSFTRLIFEVNKTATPKSTDPNSNDNRRLGLAVSDIEINSTIIDK